MEKRVEQYREYNAAEEEARFRYAAIVESSEDAIISGTLKGIIVSWNAGAEHIYGYTEAEAVGRSISILVPPDLPDEENKILGALRSGRRVEHFETVRVTKEGKRINVSLSISPIKDCSGRTVGISGIARDITLQKRVEDELRASEKRLRLAQWAARIGTFDVNFETGVDIWTPETEALYGLPPGTFGGTLTAFHNLIHPDDRERISELTHEMMRTGQPTEAEWRVIWPDGSVHWIASRGQVLMNESDEPSRMLGVNLDVTDRKLAEENTGRFLSVFEYSAVGMALVAYDGHWIRVNKALCEILGYSEQELLATNFQSLTHPDDLDADLSCAQKVFTGQLRFYHMEKRYIHKQGHVVWVTLSASGVPDASGNVSYGIAQVQDITARKNVEAVLRQDQEELQSLAGRLITVQEEERKRIARELHDDISQRIALLGTMLQRLQHGQSTSEAELTHEIGEANKQLQQLGTDVQVLSHRLHSAKLEYLGLAAAAAGFCREFSQQHSVQIDFHSEGIPKGVSPEVSLCLFRILQEAVQNAAKHSGSANFQVSINNRSDEIELRVHDSGVGFEPGVALNHGLGLTSMKERLRLVSGKLSIDSQAQRGTTIHARVPLAS